MFFKHALIGTTQNGKKYFEVSELTFSEFPLYFFFLLFYYIRMKIGSRSQVPSTDTNCTSFLFFTIAASKEFSLLSFWSLVYVQMEDI